MIRRIPNSKPSGRVNALLLVLAGVGVVVGGAQAEDTIPKAAPASKYAKMAAHSPFAPPTAPIITQAAPTPPPAPGWADSLSVTMIVQDGSKYMVTVVDAQNPQHLYLTSEPDPNAAPADPNELAVASVKWGANREDPPTITLRKGKEFAQVHYESGASSPGGNNAMGMGGSPRNPSGVPAIPGAQVFHPPPLPNGAQGGNPIPSSSAIRRPLIRSQPQTAPPVIRPGLNPGGPAVRPNPGVPTDDDDDD